MSQGIIEAISSQFYRCLGAGQPEWQMGEIDRRTLQTRLSSHLRGHLPDRIEPASPSR